MLKSVAMLQLPTELVAIRISPMAIMTWILAMLKYVAMSKSPNMPKVLLDLVTTTISFLANTTSTLARLKPRALLEFLAVLWFLAEMIPTLAMMFSSLAIMTLNAARILPSQLQISPMMVLAAMLDL